MNSCLDVVNHQKLLEWNNIVRIYWIKINGMFMNTKDLNGGVVMDVTSMIEFTKNSMTLLQAVEENTRL